MLLRRGLGQIAVGSAQSSPHLLCSAPCSFSISSQASFQKHPSASLPGASSPKEASSESLLQCKWNAGACMSNVGSRKEPNSSLSRSPNSRSIRTSAKAGGGGSTSKPSARKSKLQVMLEEKQAKSDKKKLERSMQKEKERQLRKEGRSASKRAAPSQFTILGSADGSPEPEAAPPPVVNEAANMLFDEGELIPEMPRKLSQAEKERERLHRQAYGMRSPEEVPRRGDLARFVLPPLSIPTSDPFGTLAGNLSSNTNPTTPSHTRVVSNPVEAASSGPSSSSSTTTSAPAAGVLEPSAPAPASPSAESPPASTHPFTSSSSTGDCNPVEAAPPSSSSFAHEQAAPAAATSIPVPNAPASAPSTPSDSLPAEFLPQPTASQPTETAAAAAAAPPSPPPASSPESMGSSNTTSIGSSSQAWCNFPVSLPLLSLHPLFERASAYYSQPPRGPTNLQEWEMPPLPWKPWKKRGGELRRLSGVHQVLIVEDKDDLPQAVRWLEQDLWPYTRTAPTRQTAAPHDTTSAGHAQHAAPPTLPAGSSLPSSPPDSARAPPASGSPDSDTEEDSAVPWCSSAADFTSARSSKGGAFPGDEMDASDAELLDAGLALLARSEGRSSEVQGQSRGHTPLEGIDKRSSERPGSELLQEQGSRYALQADSEAQGPRSLYTIRAKSEERGLDSDWDEVWAGDGGPTGGVSLSSNPGQGENTRKKSQAEHSVRHSRGVGGGDELPQGGCASKTGAEVLAESDWGGSSRGQGDEDGGAAAVVVSRLAGSAEESVTEAPGPGKGSMQPALNKSERESPQYEGTASSSNGSSSEFTVSTSASSSSGTSVSESLVGRRGFQRLFRLELEPRNHLGQQGSGPLCSDPGQAMSEPGGPSTELQGSHSEAVGGSSGSEDSASSTAEGLAAGTARWVPKEQRGDVREQGEADSSASSRSSLSSNAGASSRSGGDDDPPPLQQQQQQQHCYDDEPRPVIGLDIEWDPTYRPGECSPMALLQLAGPSRCLLLRIQAMQSADEKQGQSFLAAAAPLVGLLTRADVVVASMGWTSDEQRKMEGALGIIRADMPGFVDMQKVAEASGINRVGLNSLAIRVLGAPEGWVKGSKSVTQSKWSKALSDRQISYAATDAFMAADVYKQLRLLHHAEPPAHCAFCSQPLLGRSPTSQITCPIPGCRRRVRAPIQMEIGAGRSGSMGSSNGGGISSSESSSSARGDIGSSGSSSSGGDSGSEDGSEGSGGASDPFFVWTTPTFTSIKGYQKHLAHHQEEVAEDPKLSQVVEKTCVQCGRSQFLLASAHT